jgi:hypothetical protein
MITSKQIEDLYDHISKIFYFYYRLNQSKDINIPSKKQVFYFKNKDLFFDSLRLLGLILAYNSNFVIIKFPRNTLLKIVRYSTIFKTNLINIKRYRIYNSNGNCIYRNIDLRVSKEAIDFINKLTTRTLGTSIIVVNENGEI